MDRLLPNVFGSFFLLVGEQDYKTQVFVTSGHCVNKWLLQLSKCFSFAWAFNLS